jgi:hypothetical protein
MFKSENTIMDCDSCRNFYVLLTSKCEPVWYFIYTMRESPSFCVELICVCWNHEGLAATVKGDQNHMSTANKTKLFVPWRHNCLKNVWSLILFHGLFNIKIGLGNCQGLHFSLICILLEVNWFEVKCLQNIAGKLSKVPPTTWTQLFP